MTCKSSFTIGALLLFASMASWAADGAALYSRRCASCHGAKGEGRRQGPPVKGATMDMEQMVNLMTKGESTSKAPHNRGMSQLKEEEAKAIAQYVKTL